jgi:hypothetical protein
MSAGAAIVVPSNMMFGPFIYRHRHKGVLGDMGGSPKFCSKNVMHSQQRLI